MSEKGKKNVEKVEVKIVDPTPKTTPETVGDKVEGKKKEVLKTGDKAREMLKASIARQKLSLDPNRMKESVSTPEGRKKLGDSLPEGKMKATFKALEADKMLPDGPMKNTMLVLIAFMAKYGGLFENMAPGSFMKSLDDEKNKNLSFGEKDMLNIFKGEGREVNTESLKDYGREAASVAYVCSRLGVEEMTNSKSLAARMKHLNGANNKPFYKVAGVSALSSKKTAKPGTVMMFTSSLFDTEIITAIADSDGLFEYVDKTKTGKPVIKKASASELLTSALFLKAAFVPTGLKNKPAEKEDKKVEKKAEKKVLSEDEIKKKVGEIGKSANKAKEKIKTPNKKSLSEVYNELLKMKKGVNELISGKMTQYKLLLKMEEEMHSLAKEARKLSAKLNESELDNKFNEFLKKLEKAMEKLKKRIKDEAL